MISRFRKRNGKILSAAFFLGGVLFDVFTLGRIDRPFALTRLGAMLLLCAALLNLDLIASVKSIAIPARLSRLWRFREGAIHFLFGGLLSAYAVYYFKSASLVRSGLFILLLFGLLLANELPRFKRLGPVVKYGLYSLCLGSYFAFLVPILVGGLGTWEFLLAILLSSSIIGVNGAILWRALGVRRGFPRILNDTVVIPWGVQLSLLGLYFAGAIPPVPLSIKYLGIYHGIEKEQGQYVLLHERPEWHFWENGDQRFFSRPGDRVYLFVRIFSPTNFRDRVELRWFRREERAGWTFQDAIPLEIRGGREEGYRGVAVKSNYVSGFWRVLVVTEDGREIGRITFEIVDDVRLGERVFVREIDS